MKNLTTFISESNLVVKTIKENKEKLANLQDNTIDYISTGDLKKYLEITDKFISEPAKYVINYLIDHNSTYISELGNDKAENALAGFYMNGIPSDPKYKELYKNLGDVVKSGNILEIPVFQTKAQFDAIISKKSSVDTIILDFSTEKGRNAIAKRYNPLMHKICRQWLGKINLDYDQLMSVAGEGLAYAMNTYGKKNKSSKAEDENVAGTTFSSYAAYCIRNAIIGWGVEDSHTIHISKTDMKKEREEKGYNTKSYTTSGDKIVGNDKEGNGKTLFDFIDAGEEDAEANMNTQDLNKLWKEIYDELEKKFDKKMVEAWYSFNGLNGREQLKNKDIASKYDISSSNITYYCYKINQYLSSDKKMLKLLGEVYELMQECLNEEERNQHEIDETFNVNTNIINISLD